MSMCELCLCISKPRTLMHKVNVLHLVHLHTCIWCRVYNNTYKYIDIKIYVLKSMGTSRQSQLDCQYALH